MQFTGITPDVAERLKHAINGADAILIGAGAGLSAAAGLTGDGERFRRFFPDFIKKYHFRDMYTAGFYPFPTKEEFWAYWSRYVLINRYETPPKPVYRQLLNLVKDKDYFVLTTNVDHCFQKAGFDKERLFYTQGDYGLFQCSTPCHRRTYDNEETILRMVREQRNMRVPTELLPLCPKCGAPMAMNLRSDDTFVEDLGWNEAASRYLDFVQSHANKRLLLLELGVGMNTPSIIKYPFWRLTAQHPNAAYVCVNLGEADCPKELENRALLLNADLADTIAALQ
ncbi:MAG: Sir2 silent information regulator family NAD-dependent deacetylase [Clostridia bacterium]|nr:Sir2 silent information regulator family NAD-dependent deacetylase [Clostridia bacterium]